VFGPKGSINLADLEDYEELAHIEEPSGKFSGPLTRS
jgi:hypothetical protein